PASPAGGAGGTACSRRSRIRARRGLRGARSHSRARAAVAGTPARPCRAAAPADGSQIPRARWPCRSPYCVSHTIERANSNGSRLGPRTPGSGQDGAMDLPEVDDLLSHTRVVALPMATRFRGVDHREAALIEGPEGWAEFSPFLEYDDAEA